MALIVTAQGKARAFPPQPWPGSRKMLLSVLFDREMQPEDVAESVRLAMEAYRAAHPPLPPVPKVLPTLTFHVFEGE
jgi:hypothetical protein